MRLLTRSLLLCLSSLVLSLTVSAQTAPKRELKHQPPKLAELGVPGQKLTLKVELIGARDINQSIRALVVSDGKMMDLPLTGSIDEYDRVVYSLDLAAPLAELVYQFILRPTEGAAVVSQRYNLTRQCLPQVSLTDLESLDKVERTQRAKELVKIAASLERDVKLYNQILSQLTQLKANSPQSSGGQSVQPR